MSVGNAKMVRISGVSIYPGFELSGSNCTENSTPKQRGMEIWFEWATNIRNFSLFRIA